MAKFAFKFDIVHDIAHVIIIHFWRKKTYRMQKAWFGSKPTEKQLICLSSRWGYSSSTGSAQTEDSVELDVKMAIGIQGTRCYRY